MAENRGGGSGNVPAYMRTTNPYATAKKHNPYASKKPKSSAPDVNCNVTRRSSNPVGDDPPNHPSGQALKVAPAAASRSSPGNGMQAYAGSSFSQAFGSIEDTEYFKKSAGETPMEDSNAADRAEQRALEDSMTDRDHHVLIQPHVLSVSTKQRGNGVLNHIRNVPMAFSRQVPDYLLSSTSCALFLSLKYHNLHPQYIHRRIAELRTDFQLRVLLVLVDMDDNQSTLLFLNKLAVQQNLSLVLAWSEEEAARYLESYKALDGNDASLIQRKEKTNFADQAADFLAGGTGVNKTDAASLLSQFSSVKAICAASRDELGMVPGLGQVKVSKLHEAFHKPFSTKRQRERKEKAAKEASEKDDSNESPKGMEGGKDAADEDKGVELPDSDDGKAGEQMEAKKKKVSQPD